MILLKPGPGGGGEDLPAESQVSGPTAMPSSPNGLRAGGILCLVAAGMLGIGLAHVAADPMLMVDRSSVRIRRDATIQSERITVLHRGDEVEELRRHNEWIQVLLADGRAGWVHADLVQARLMVEGERVNVRSGPSAADAISTVVSRGQVLGKLGQQGNWLEVSTPNGLTGWLHKRYVRARTAADAGPHLAPAPSLIEGLSAVDAVDPGSEGGATDLGGPLIVATSDPPVAGPDSLADADPIDRDQVDADQVDADQGDTPSSALTRNPYAVGLQFEASGDHVGALASFEEALVAEPARVGALVHAARAHRALGQYDNALSKLYKALDLGEPRGQKDVYLNLGEVYRLKAEPDSAAKYQALYRGDPPQQGAEQLEGDESENETSFPWGQVAVALAGSILIATVVVLFILRRSGEKRGRGKRKQKANASFSRMVSEEETEARQGRATSGEERELDQQIEDRWRELRESSQVFESSNPRTAALNDTEEGQMNGILDQVEDLRKALDMQDERARIYADIVRLQNMRIEVMNEEVRMLRRGQRKT